MQTTFTTRRAQKEIEKEILAGNIQPIATRFRGNSFENTLDRSIGQSLTLNIEAGRRRSYHPKQIERDLMNITWARYNAEETKMDSDDELV
eukprot:CAMPEP_0184068822 /NCGR_PEP_ID=MMETSP0957-20130417/37251_1 /TAXON_ID=627963 /ORGANISM="Aplanochytrium sp, Strain PBS07" /LENGTH=90 /DNA_ID=CAMNT_0026367951 /DNA_START=28 /DNA_END=300 /DNA_ORIENTATION=-